VTNEAKVAVYNSLVLSILLFGCESWSLTQRLRDKLQTFHRGCVRDMCRLNMWHVQQYCIPESPPHQVGLEGADAQPLLQSCAVIQDLPSIY
jgi:hypothetical protein